MRTRVNYIRHVSACKARIKNTPTLSIPRLTQVQAVIRWKNMWSKYYNKWAHRGTDLSRWENL